MKINQVVDEIVPRRRLIEIGREQALYSCVRLCGHFVCVQNFEKYVGIELQMSVQDCSSNDRACASYPRFQGSSLNVIILF